MIHSATVGAVTRLIAMTTIQKSIIAATVVAAVGTGIYQAHQASTLRAEVQTLEGRQAPLAEHIQQLQRERDDATNRLASLAQEIRNNNPVDSAILQGYQIIPGIYLGNDVNDLGDWAITQKAALDDHDALRVAIGTIGVIEGFRAETDSALDAPINAFVAANNGHLPKNIYDLKPYVATPAEQAAFQKRIILDPSAPPPSPNPIQGGGFPIRYQ